MHNRNSKYTVAAGFATLICIMVLVTLAGFLRFVSIRDDINNVNLHHFTKINLLSDMHIAVRERAISLILMANISDRFDQDAEILRYHQLGTNFADARTTLLGLPLTSGERALLDKQSRLTAEVRPLHEHLIELATSGNLIGAHGYLTGQIIPKQNEIIDTVKEIHKLEDTEYQQLVKAGDTNYRLAYILFMALLSLSTVGFGAVITLLVVRKIDATETALFKEQERYSLAVRGANDGLWDWDPINNNAYFSPRWKDMLGYEDHELENRFDEWIKRLHPDDAEKTLAELKAHLNGQSYYFESEHRLLHKDGKYRWFLMRGLALRDEYGKAYRIAGSNTEITERKAYEKHLHQNESRMRMVLDHIVDAIITTNDSGVVESVNSAAEEMFGLNSQHIIGNLFSNLLADPYRQQYDHYFTTYAQGKAAAELNVNTQIRGRRAAGGSFPLICTLTEMQIGSERKLIVIAHDASSQRDQRSA